MLPLEVFGQATRITDTMANGARLIETSAFDPCFSFACGLALAFQAGHGKQQVPRPRQSGILDE